MKSMTGYGRGDSSAKGVQLAVEISSVNRRQVEVAVSLPNELDSLEADLRKIVLASVARGRVSGRVTLQRPSGKANRSILINEAQAEAYKKTLAKLADGMGLRDDLSLETILRLPGVMEAGEDEVDPVAMLPTLKRALGQALGQLQDMRFKEGSNLGRDLTKRLASLRRITKRVAKRAPKVVEHHRTRLLERLAKVDIVVADADDERFLREVVYFTDRSDISEELTRLESHFDQVDGCLISNEPVGRKLDFLAQEMFREVNTIGSKANDSEISQEVVTLKTDLEKIREQVQNVE